MTEGAGEEGIGRERERRKRKGERGRGRGRGRGRELWVVGFFFDFIDGWMAVGEWVIVG